MSGDDIEILLDTNNPVEKNNSICDSLQNLNNS